MNRQIIEQVRATEFFTTAGYTSVGNDEVTRVWKMAAWVVLPCIVLMGLCAAAGWGDGVAFFRQAMWLLLVVSIAGDLVCRLAKLALLVANAQQALMNVRALLLQFADAAADRDRRARRDARDPWADLE
jgi:hypothetical protein